MNSGSRALNSEWHRLPADELASGAARRHVISWLLEHHADPRAVEDLSLAASELAANVVQHGGATELFVRLDGSDPRCWTLEVAGGHVRLPENLADPATWRVAGPDSSHGRGLGIVRAVVDDIEVIEDGRGLAIRCHRQRADAEG